MVVVRRIAGMAVSAAVPFSPVQRAGQLYVADVVGDVYLRERIAWGARALLMPDEHNRVSRPPSLKASAIHSSLAD